MGLFSLIGSVIGGNKAKKASKKAQAIQQEYQQKALDEQRRQFDVTRADYAPYLQSGLGGLSGLSDLIGINGADAQSAGLVGVQNSPALASVIRNGEEALLANASATGGLRGGNMQRGLADFRSDAFADQLNQQIARLAGLAGLGQGATDSVSKFGANTSDNVSNIYGTMGASNAAQILSRGGINSQIWNNAGTQLDRMAKGNGLMSMFKGMF